MEFERDGIKLHQKAAALSQEGGREFLRALDRRKVREQELSVPGKDLKQAKLR